MKTYMQKTAEVKRDWHLVDAKDQVLGRLATEIATMLMGKNKPEFTPHIEGGDYVVVVNAQDVVVTRDKANKKMYRHHTGFPGGLKEIVFSKLQEKQPEKIIQLAVKNMLPKNKHRALIDILLST